MTATTSSKSGKCLADGFGAAVRQCFKDVESGKDVRKLLPILLNNVSKEQVLSWVDENGLDVLHHAIMSNSEDAVDFFLMNGYFMPPHEPKVNLYAHFAACLGYYKVLCVVLEYRPDDFKIGNQSLFIPSWYKVKQQNSLYTKDRSQRPGNDPQMTGESSYAQSGDITTGRIFQSMDRPGPEQIQEENMAPSVNGKMLTLAPSPRRRSSPFEVKQLLPPIRSPKSSIRRYSSPGIECMAGSQLTPISVVNLRTADLPADCNVTPLEVAACYQNVDCVKVLLDMYVGSQFPEYESKGYITLATLTGDLPSLRLLTDPVEILENVVRKEDYKTAVEVALFSAASDCIGFLLNTDFMDVKAIYKQPINFYHFLYCHPKANFSSSTLLSRLPDSTDLLIKNGYPVNQKVPPRTYALYSILEHSFSHNVFNNSDSIFRCIQKLVTHGADPNFNEIAFERCVITKISTSTIASYQTSSRNAFASGFHCVFESAIKYRERYPWRGHVLHFVQECLETLINANADIEQIGHMSDNPQDKTMGNALFCFTKTSVLLGLDRSLFNSVMRYGAQPHHKVNGQYALNYYFEKLLEMVKHDNYQRNYLNELENMVVNTCKYLAPWHIREVLRTFNSRRHSACETNENGAMINKIIDLLVIESRRVHGLRFLSAWIVWKKCGRNLDGLKRLPINKKFICDILPLVLFNRMW